MTLSVDDDLLLILSVHSAPMIASCDQKCSGKHDPPSSVDIKPPDDLLMYIVPFYLHKAQVCSALRP